MDIKKISSFTVIKDGKLQLLIDGIPADLTDVKSIDIHIEAGCISLRTEKIEHYKFTDKQEIVSPMDAIKKAMQESIKNSPPINPRSII